MVHWKGKGWGWGIERIREVDGKRVSRGQKDSAVRDRQSALNVADIYLPVTNVCCCPWRRTEQSVGKNVDPLK